MAKAGFAKAVGRGGLRSVVSKQAAASALGGGIKEVEKRKNEVVTKKVESVER